jgi:hypothetical protein
MKKLVEALAKIAYTMADAITSISPDYTKVTKANMNRWNLGVWFTLEEGSHKTIRWYIATHIRKWFINEKLLFEHSL